MEKETSPTGKTRVSDERDLRIVFELAPNAGCPLREVEGDVQDATVQVHEEGCDCDFLVSVDTDDHEHVEHQSVTIEDRSKCRCACQVFGDYGCVPHLQETNADTVVIATYVPDRDVAWKLLDALGEVSDTVRLLRVTSDSEGGLGDISELDLSVLSEKQRVAMERAVRMGYYDADTTVSLSEMAADLDISPSALSQRLKRAEEKLMSQIFR